jgi:hypothetical protein
VEVGGNIGRRRDGVRKNKGSRSDRGQRNIGSRRYGDRRK